MFKSFNSFFTTCLAIVIVVTLLGCDDKNENEKWLSDDTVTPRIALVSLKYQYQLPNLNFVTEPTQSTTLLFDRMTHFIQISIEEKLRKMEWIDIDDIYNTKPYIQAVSSANVDIDYMPARYKYIDLEQNPHFLQEIAKETGVRYFMAIKVFVPMSETQEAQLKIQLTLADYTGRILYSQIEPLGLFWRQLVKNNIATYGNYTKIENEEAIVHKFEGVDFGNKENRAMFEEAFKRYMNAKQYLIPL